MARVLAPAGDAFFSLLKETERRLSAIERRLGPPTALVESTAFQPIGNNVFPWIVLDFDQAEFDNGEMWNGSDRLTFPGDGVYLCGLEIPWSLEPTTGVREARIHHHLTELETDRYKGPSITVGSEGFNHLSVPIVASAGDYIRAVVYQASGATLQAIDPCRLWATRIL